MDPDVDSILLTLLSRMPSSPGHSSVSGQHNKETGLIPFMISMQGARYNLIDSTVDLLLRDAGSSRQAARIVLAVRKAVSDVQGNNNNSTESRPSKTGVLEQPTIEFAAHSFCLSEQSSPLPHISIISTIIDTKAMHASQSTTALRASTIPTSPEPPPQSPRRTLHDTYHSYVAVINAGAAAMSSHLTTFCHPVVTHNGQALSRRRYQRLMQDAQEAIPDINFHVADLIADEERQLVAARLEFTGRPVRTWAGVEPNGRRVDFSEQAFYWFEEGRIRSVVSLLDMDAYRKNMRF